jgi:hypothetical protein
MKFSPRWGIVNVTLGRTTPSILPPARPNYLKPVQENADEVDSDQSRWIDDHSITGKRSWARFSKYLAANGRSPDSRDSAGVDAARTPSRQSRPETNSDKSSQSTMPVQCGRRSIASRAYLIANIPLVLAVFLLPHLHVYLWGLLGVGSAGAIIVGCPRPESRSDAPTPQRTHLARPSARCRRLRHGLFVVQLSR